MDVDPMRSRACIIQATHAGYVSTSIAISALNGYLDPNINLEPIKITSRTADPYTIIMSEASMPLSARSALKAAMQALDSNNYSEARRQFQAAVQAAPKFAPGWHALGVVLDRENALKEAREAFEHAIESNPKMLSPYMTLVRLCIRTKDWECAARTADDLVTADKKRLYPDVYLHRAVAQYELKDLDKAMESAREALNPAHGTPRAEYVYGRILEAKGDINGAREHMSRYLELNKDAPDSEAIRQHLQNLGKSETTGAEPELEYP
jgi:tetratricopeptide (TPR) repeat protein